MYYDTILQEVVEIHEVDMFPRFQWTRTAGPGSADAGKRELASNSFPLRRQLRLSLTESLIGLLNY